MMKCVVLLSGGLDSTTTAAIAATEGYELYVLTINYGQRHGRELISARDIAKTLGAREHLLINFDLGKIGGSALTTELEVPKEGVDGSRVKGTIPITYVPARNTIFLSFALSWAEVLRAPDIFIGANVADYSGYPDCRPEYLKAFEQMANLATKLSVEKEISFRVRTPLLFMSKSEIIKKGVELGVDYGQTWSCYDPLPEGGPCGSCDSCLIRAKGFREAGIKDPLLK